MTEYLYSLANDFPNHVVATDRLVAEIRASAIVTALDRIDTLGDACSVWFRGPLSGTDEAILAALVAAHLGTPLADPPVAVDIFGSVGKAQQNTDGLLQFTTEPRVGTEVIYATHNFSDPTTWFGDSVRVEDEVATDDGDGLSWSLANGMLIDLTHGKIFDEDAYILDQQTANPGSPHGYAIVVRVNGVLKTQRAAFAPSGGDYTVAYGDGKIVFAASQAGNTVLVSYSYENGSTFYIVPEAGTNVDIEKAKSAWSDNFVMNDTVEFQVWGYAAVFAPQLGLPAGTKIPILTTAYKTLAQLTAEASAFGPFAIPATGGTVRGLAQPQHIVEFRYGTLRRLLSAYGIELRVKLENDMPMGGDFTTATFYCVVRSAT